MSRHREPRIVDAATHPRRYVGLGVASDYLGVDIRTLGKYLDARLLAFHMFGTRRKVAGLSVGG